MTASWRLFAWSLLALAACSSPNRPGPSPAGSGGSGGGSGADSGVGGATTAGTAGIAGTAGAAHGGSTGDGGSGGVAGNGGAGPETNCTNGQDDNGNLLIDCADPTCAAACATSCGSAVPLADPSSVFGSTSGHAALLDSSCRSPGNASGPEVVYRVKVAKTGLFRTHLDGVSANLTVSVRTACNDAKTELSCTLLYTTTPVTAGETVYVIVDGYDALSEGTYTLAVDSGPIVCGDGNRDPGEDCDDRNTTAGDGCSPSCKIESSESASNDTTATADAYPTNGYFGTISPAGDVDVVRIDVTTAGSSITATVNDFADQACRLGLMDSMVEILSPDGSQVLAANDDRSVGDRCSAATASNLVAGTYFVRVSAGNGGAVPTFGYHLDIAVAGP